MPEQTVPICITCWNARCDKAGRPENKVNPLNPQSGKLETCQSCGKPTTSGLYVVTITKK